jgi:ATP-dependent DNA helicase RecQ
VVVGGFDRPNITLDVRHFVDDDTKRAAVLDTVAGLDGSGMLYCATRKDTELYMLALSERGVSAAAYHAGLKAAERDDVHRRFHDDAVQVVAATSAFGMGIDKSNVRFIVHASVPDSVDSYYQQIGRAGRDDEPALAVLFYRAEDLSLGTLFATSHPDEELLGRICSVLRTDKPQRLDQLRNEVGVRGRALTRSLNLLEQAGVAIAGRRGWSGRDTTLEEGVRRAVATATTAETVERTRVEMLRTYAETTRCRRRHLLAYFGDHLDAACGNCDRCRDDPTAADAGAPAIPAQTRVDHREWGQGVVLDGDDDRITVLFDDHGYRTLSIEAVDRRDLLTVTGNGAVRQPRGG